MLFICGHLDRVTFKYDFCQLFSPNIHTWGIFKQILYYPLFLDAQCKCEIWPLNAVQIELVRFQTNKSVFWMRFLRRLQSIFGSDLSICGIGILFYNGDTLDILVWVILQALKGFRSTLYQKLPVNVYFLLHPSEIWSYN